MESSYEFYTTGHETWESMLDACRKAEKTIDLEQYIFYADSIGKEFIDIFIQKSRSGVKVRMLLDTVGSYLFYSSSVPAALRKEGIEVRFFNPISPWRIYTFTSWIFRNHRKSLVIDGKISFTGGTGMAEYMGKWRDTNARIEGVISTEMSESFEEMWRQASDGNIFRRFKKARSVLKRHFYIPNTPYFRRRYLYYCLVEAMRGATKNIWLTTPYFILDRRLMRILRLAVRRGVDVRVILPSKSDVPIMETASNSSVEGLLRDGVRIYKYLPAIMHGKTAIVDDEWGTFGSFNLDNLSFVYNFEANVVSTESACVSNLRKHFLADIAASKEILWKDWQDRPLSEKIKEFCVAPIRSFL